jgi:regulatory protein
MRSDVDLAYLKRAAAAYLARYAASAAQLERVLQRRVAKRCRISGADPADHAETVKAAVAFCAGAGLVDDAAFAAGRTATLAQRGWPERRIRAALAQKGVTREAAEAALAKAEIDDAAAARRFAERRRLGPFRPPDARAEKRDKDIAAMMRAGFGFELARATIGRAEESGG